MRPIHICQLLACTLIVASSASFAQQTWRCPGRYYTNDPLEAQKRGGCTLLTEEHGRVTVVPSPPPSSRPVTQQDDAQDNKPEEDLPPPMEDQQRQQLERKLNQLQQELTQLEAVYKNGAPDPIGRIETHNRQMYLNRVERLKNEVEQKRAQVQAAQKQLQQDAQSRAQGERSQAN